MSHPNLHTERRAAAAHQQRLAEVSLRESQRIQARSRALKLAARETAARARAARIYHAVLRFLLAEAAAAAPAVPSAELALLRDWIDSAVLAAAEGTAEHGYTELELGLLWAETPAIDPVTQVAESQPAWTGMLVDLYRRAIVEYARIHGLLVALPEPPDDWPA